MIEPNEKDIGRTVIYKNGRELDRGVITSFNDHSVFVRYGSDHGSKATNRADLHWEVTYDAPWEIDPPF